MMKEFCAGLKDRINSAHLPFAEVVAGAVKTVFYENIDPQGNVYRYSMPVSWDTNIAPCGQYDTPEKELVPNAERRGILYFEEHGATISGSSSYGTKYTGLITCVCWYNKALIIGNGYEHLQSTFLAMLYETLRIDRSPFNQWQFTRCIMNPVKLKSQDISAFQKYTYSELDRQFLMPPYEFFAVDFNVEFCVPQQCLQPVNNTYPSDCRTWL